jgi:hypothetical protein
MEVVVAHDISEVVGHWLPNTAAYRISSVMEELVVGKVVFDCVSLVNSPYTNISTSINPTLYRLDTHRLG